MIRSLTVLAAGVAAFAVAASATASPGVQITIRHEVRGCHAWAVATGPYKAAQTLSVKAGTTLTFTNNDVMPHTLIQLKGAHVTPHNLAAPAMGMGLRGPFPAGMMGRMGAATTIRLTKPGTYSFKTKAGEDYMQGMKTIGEDNVLTLVVVVK